MQYLIAVCNRPEAASDAISGSSMSPYISVPVKLVKFRDPRLDRSRDIRPKAVGDSILAVYSNTDKCLPGAADDVISGVAVANIHAKFGDSMSNRSRDIRSAQFVMDDDDAGRRTL